MTRTVRERASALMLAQAPLLCLLGSIIKPAVGSVSLLNISNMTYTVEEGGMWHVRKGGLNLYGERTCGKTSTITVHSFMLAPVVMVDR